MPGTPWVISEQLREDNQGTLDDSLSPPQLTETLGTPSLGKPGQTVHSLYPKESSSTLCPPASEPALQGGWRWKLSIQGCAPRTAGARPRITCGMREQTKKKKKTH